MSRLASARVSALRIERDANPAEGGKPSLRAAQKLLTRERLIDAALEVFEREGYRDTTVDLIAKQAGTDRTTFYLYFRNKADLFRPIGARTESEWLALWMRLNQPDKLSLRTMRAWMVDAAHYWMNNSMLVHFVQDGMSCDPKLADEYNRGLRHYAGLLDAVLGPLDKTRREEAVQKIVLLLMMVSQYFYSVIVQGGAMPGRAQLNAVADLWWHGCFEHFAGRRGA